MNNLYRQMNIDGLLRNLYEEAYDDGVTGIRKTERVNVTVSELRKLLPEEHPDSWQSNKPQIAYELGRREYRSEVLRLLEAKDAK
jgi:hypothetical protein